MPTRGISPPRRVPPSSSSSSSSSSSEEEEGPPSPKYQKEQYSDNNEDSEEEEEEEEDYGSDPESEKRQTGPNVKPVNSKHTENASKPKNLASSETDLESGSESESDFLIKPVSSKPKDITTPQKAIISEPKPKTAAKRPAEPEKDEKESKKKAKLAKDDEEEEPDKKKLLFQRLWSEDDEIVVLKGMMDFNKAHGTDPQAADMSALLESIKGLLHIDVTNRQLSEKIRRLKKKYQNNESKSKKGSSPSFSKPHEQKTYELSKKIWGKEAVDGEETRDSDVKANLVIPKKSKQVKTASLTSPANVLRLEEKLVEPSQDLGNGFLYQMLKEPVDLHKGINVSILSDNLVKKGLSLLDSSKAKELAEKWESLHIMELEVYLKRVNLVRDQTKMILDALKK